MKKIINPDYRTFGYAARVLVKKAVDAAFNTATMLDRIVAVESVRMKDNEGEYIALVVRAVAKIHGRAATVDLVSDRTSSIFSVWKSVWWDKKFLVKF
jgi:hypothetical protein